MGGRKSLISRIFTSRIFLVLILILVIIFLVGISKACWRDYQIQKEIKALEQEKEHWEKNKIQILNRLNEVKSQDFIEKEARLNFGLAKPGESLVIITEPVKSIAATAESTASNPSRPPSNLTNWWNYLFQ